MTRKLAVDMRELSSAFDYSEGITSYLDVDTGAVLHITDDVLFGLKGALLDDDDWRHESAPEALQIQDDLGVHYLEVPQVDSLTSYNEMVEFIATVEDDHLRELLEVAIHGKGLFGVSRMFCMATRKPASDGLNSRMSRCGGASYAGWLLMTLSLKVEVPQPPRFCQTFEHRWSVMQITLKASFKIRSNLMQESNVRIALCYVRQSGTSKTSQDVIERQGANILRVCEAHGWEPEWYEDVDEPGLEHLAGERPAWEVLQERFGAPDVVALVADNLTRLHRDPAELDALLQTLEDYDIQLVTAASMSIFT